jgi:hypothetical protein
MYVAKIIENSCKRFFLVISGTYQHENNISVDKSIC